MPHLDKQVWLEAEIRLLFNEGLHVKATGDALIFAPAFVAGEDEIARMTDILRKVLGRSDL